jgi:cytochrome c peroxidase
MKLHEGETGPDDIGPDDGNWDTPTLHEIWRTAPYLHDGRTMALGEVLGVEPMKSAVTEPLSRADTEDLVAYLKSL